MTTKLGIKKTRGRSHAAVKEKTVAHKHVPGRAYEIDDPTTKLITMIGGGFFNEPKYYDTNRDPVDFYAELRATGKISSVIVDKMGLSEQAREVIQTANHVAEAAPEDLMVIAAWARDPEHGLKLRYTPQIMLALAAANQQTKPFVAKYARSVIRRADEIRHVFAAYRHLFCGKKSGLYHGAIPHCLRRALSVAFASQSIYGLLKYNSADRPTFGDILLTLGGKGDKKFLERMLDREFDGGFPLRKPMFEYLVNGKITDGAPGMLKARQEFFALKKIKDVTKELLDAAGLTWENIVSQFGSSKEVWEMAIPYMGEMALVRNLRNFEEAKLSEAAWDAVYEKCNSVADTRQLPFRFFAADRATTSTNAKSVSNKMLDNACQNVPGLTGVTAIFVDNSGSAVGCSMSGKSSMCVSDAGNTLGAIIAKKVGRKCHVGVFGDSLIWVQFAETDSCMAIKREIDLVANHGDRRKLGALAIDSHWLSGSGVGGGTETGLWCGIHDLTKRKVHIDRFIICSDFCCYTQGDAYNCGHQMNRYFGKGGSDATIQSMINRYRMAVNPDAWVHSIDLQGHGQAQLDTGAKRVQCLSGWSEQVFSLIQAAEAETEQRVQVSDEPVEVPTIELLRQRYRVE